MLTMSGSHVFGGHRLVTGALNVMRSVAQFTTTKDNLYDIYLVTGQRYFTVATLIIMNVSGKQVNISSVSFTNTKLNIFVAVINHLH